MATRTKEIYWPNENGISETDCTVEKPSFPAIEQTYGCYAFDGGIRMIPLIGVKNTALEDSF